MRPCMPIAMTWRALLLTLCFDGALGEPFVSYGVVLAL